MTTAAIMQPYFFPYLGYWQLIAAADEFILFDDAQYMRHGWINRNRILKPGPGWHYITAPLTKPRKTTPIASVITKNKDEWKALILRQLDHYKKKADHFSQTMDIVADALYATDSQYMSIINESIINTVCERLNIKTDISLASRINFDYTHVRAADEWALQICQQIDADHYLNPISGAHLFDAQKYKAAEIKLSFLEPSLEQYGQMRPHEPNLSIIDSLMFNGVAGTRRLLDQYELRHAY